MEKSLNIVDKLVPISLFNQGKAAKIFERLSKEKQLVVLKNNQPSAVLLSPEEYSRLHEIEEDYYLLTEANKRLNNSNSKAISYSDAIARLGIDELKVAEEDELL